MILQFFYKPQILGLILDIIGAYYIAGSFIFKKPKSLLNECYGTTRNGMSGELFRSFYKQAIEAKIGFVVLAIGFIGQISSILFPNLILDLWLGFIIFAGSIIIPSFLFKYFFSQKHLDKVEQEEEKFTINL